MRSAGSYTPIESAANSDILLRYLFASFWSFVFLRFILNANLLDEIVNYSADGGSIVEKIHPSSYGIMAILIATLLSIRIELNHWELRALRALIKFVTVTGLIIAFTMLLGHSASTGYLVDSYFVACASGALMLFFPRRWREWLERNSPPNGSAAHSRPRNALRRCGGNRG